MNYGFGLFILKLDKETSYLHSKEYCQSIFGQPFGHEHNILSTKSLNIFSSLVMYEQSNYPPSGGGGGDVEVTNW